MVLGALWGLDLPLGSIAIPPAGHHVPFLRTAARFQGGIDGFVLIRSSNRAILQPNFLTAVQAGPNGDGCVKLRYLWSVMLVVHSVLGAVR